MEEVYRAAVDDAEELGSPLAHHVADRTHADDHFEVLVNLQDQVLEELVVRFVRLAIGLSLVHEHERVGDIVGLGHQLGDAAGVEEVVDADQELLLDDLAIRDD